MAYEALYRRYRPGRFGDVSGQTHVMTALKNAVAHGRVGHAYLFSGPRGTGKTSSARILAKALNCTNLTDGEPCCECDSCLTFQAGTSYDLRELDAASNNGVEAMRDLISKVGLSAGGHGVFILDEVHMLSTGAENALLKTLEEPPPNVTFILATTEPNKVVPTIRSRTQHFEFSLLSADELTDLVREVSTDAELSVTDADVDYVVRTGRGSARDTLSALDQVVAAGGAPEDADHSSAIIEALANRDTGSALVAINDATQAGREPELIARGLLNDLRNAFLAVMRANLSHLSEGDRAAAESRSTMFGAAAITRALELLGAAVVEMRQAPDPRVDLELAIVRLTRPDLDTDPNALIARIERLEQGQPAGGPAPAPMAPAPAAAPEPVPEPQYDAPPQSPPDQPMAAEQQAPEYQAPQQQAPQQEAPQQQAPQQEAPQQQAPQQQAAPPRAGGRPADIARRALQAENQSPAPAAAPPPQQVETPTAPAQPQAPVAQPPVEQAAPPAAAPQQGSKPTLGSMRRASGDAPPAAPPQDSPPPDSPPPVGPPQASPPPAAPPEMQPQDTQPQDVPAPVAEMQQQAPAPQAPPQQAPPQQAAPAPAAAGSGISMAQAAEAWSASILGALPGRVKSRFSAGQFLESDDSGLVFGLPNDVHRQRCEDVRADVDAAMTAHFGQPVPMSLVVGGADAYGAEPEAPAEVIRADEDSIDINDLTDAPDAGHSVEERLTEAFPGSEFLEPEPEGQ